MSEAKEYWITARVSAEEKRKLQSLRVQSGLPTMTAVIKLLVAQSDGILGPRVIGRPRRQNEERAEYAPAQGG
jgi:hypothetical protein